MRSDELPDVRPAQWAHLNISDHTFSVAWGPQSPSRGQRYVYEPAGPWSERLRRELLASFDGHISLAIVTGAQGPWAQAHAIVDPEDWWIDPTHEGTLAYRIALPTIELRKARRARMRNRMSFIFYDDAGFSPSERGNIVREIDWLCGLDKKTLVLAGAR